VVLERLKRPSEFPPEDRKTSVGDVEWSQHRQAAELHAQDLRDTD